MKTSPSKLRKFIAEEKATVKDYNKRGYHTQARQEARHAKYFEQKLKQQLKQGKKK